jgi:hypothetical protein
MIRTALVFALATAAACVETAPAPGTPATLEIELGAGAGVVTIDQGGARVALPASVASGRAVIAGDELLDVELELQLDGLLDQVVLQLGVQTTIGGPAEIAITATTPAGDQAERLVRGVQLELDQAELQLELAAAPRAGVAWSVVGVTLTARGR